MCIEYFRTSGNYRTKTKDKAYM
uniref:Uncharacterized protein n=1 Tax=Arundo donax TaxID=35708 RepID=A0A0A9H3S2_ARUDO